MNSNPVAESSRPPDEPGRGFFQNVALLPQRLHFAAEAAQFRALFGRQTVGALAVIKIRLPRPVTNRLRRRLELTRQRLR